MTKPMDTPCTAVAENGEVIVECGSAVVSLTPVVATDAGDQLRDAAEQAKAQIAYRQITKQSSH